jgi:glycosyltransferase involved in cell wall biosynthesis
MEGHQPQVEVSVIVPCRNAASTLGTQLDALSRQTYSGTCELLVVDNDSTDATPELLQQGQSRLPNLRVIRATEKHNSGYARNAGMRAARGQYLLFCDADDMVEPDWIRSLAEALKVYDLAGGVMAYDALNPGIRKELLPKPQTGLPVNAWNNRAFVPSGNRGVRRAVALAIGTKP